MTDKDKSGLNDVWAASQSVSTNMHLNCDLEKYRDQVQAFCLTPEEETEFLKSLWLIMAAFVDMGFGVDSIQLLPDNDEASNLPISVIEGKQKEPCFSKGDCSHD